MTNQRPTKIAINARLLVSILLSVLVIALLATNGCGGGGGGGRQVLPGENPIGPGTGTGSGTGTGTGTGSGTGTGTGTESPSKVLADGWLDMAADNFYGAQDKFQSVTTRSDATTAEKAEGFNGLGWARAKANGLVTGMSDFTQAGSLVEAELGMASALIQRAQLDDVKQAVTLFETIQLGAPSFVLTVTHAAIGISNAEAHAMLAYAYYWRGASGDDIKARDQINAARQQDSSSTSPVGQIYNLLKKLGLAGI